MQAIEYIAAYETMLQCILDCLGFMSRSKTKQIDDVATHAPFLGRAALPDSYLPPWQKINDPDQTPWHNERETRRHSNMWDKEKSRANEMYYEQQELQFEDAETAWQKYAGSQTVEAATAEEVMTPEQEAQTELFEPEPEPVPAVPEQVRVRRVNRTDSSEDQLIPYIIEPKRRVVKPTNESLFWHSDGQQKPKPTPNSLFIEVKRSWPEPRQKHERRMTAANYAAVEIHGFFGLIDDGSDGAGRMLVVHVPRWVKGFFMDIKQGDTIHVYHAQGLKIGGTLTVLSTGRHQYYRPGRRVTTCTICVPEEQWAPFAVGY